MKVIAPELDTQKSKESIRRGGVDDESTASLRNSAQLIEQARHGGERDVFRDSNCEHRVETSVIEGQRQCRSDDTARDIAELNTPEEPSPSYVQANCRGAQSGKAPEVGPDIQRRSANPSLDMRQLGPSKRIFRDRFEIAEIRQPPLPGAFGCRIHFARLLTGWTGISVPGQTNPWPPVGRLKYFSSNRLQYNWAGATYRSGAWGSVRA